MHHTYFTTDKVDVFDFKTKTVEVAKDLSGNPVAPAFTRWDLACTIVDTDHSMVITGGGANDLKSVVRFDIDTM